MPLSMWSKIDITEFQSEVERLIASAAVEGAFVNKSGTCIEGDLYDKLEIHCLVNVSNKGYRVYCSVCGSDLCCHSAVLVSCYIKNEDSFEGVEHIKVPRNWSGKVIPFQKQASKPVLKKSLKKRFIKMLEGLDFAKALISELLSLSSPVSSGVSLKSFKQQISRLDEFYLPGIKFEFLALLDLISISGVESSFLNRLNKLNQLLKNSQSDLLEHLKGECVDNPYSVLTTARGHVWKMAELERSNRFCDAKLLQLNFSTYENLLAQRIEETGVWLDLKSGEVHFTKNYRPFKALRYIPESNSVHSTLNCRGLVKYPGSGSRRIRWKSDTAQELSPADISQAWGLAQEFDVDEQKRMKALLRDSFSVEEAYGFYKVERFSCGQHTSIATIGGQHFNLLDSYESKLLRTFNSSQISDLACLFKFEISNGALGMRPLCIVFRNKVIRLGF